MQNTSTVPKPTHRDFARQSTSRAERDNALARLCGGAARGLFCLTADGHQVITSEGHLVTLNSGNAGITISDVVQPAAQGWSMAAHSNFIASTVAPLTQIAKPFGVWFSQGAADAVTVAQSSAATPGGRLNEIGPTIRNTTFTTTQQGLAYRAGRQLVDAADFDLEAVAAVRLGMAFGLRREIEAATLIMSSTTYAAGNVAAAAVKWNGVTPTRLVDIYARYAASPLPLDTMVISEAAEPYFFGSSEIQAFVDAGGKLPRVVIGRARQANPVAASGYKYIWGNLTAANAALLAAPNNPKATSSFRTFSWCPDGVPAERVVDGVAFYTANIKDYGTGGASYQTATVSEQVLSVAAPDNVAGLIAGVLA
jgi:hypothetical protein